MIWNGSLPAGGFIRALEPKPDERGVFTEVFRADWPNAGEVRQWSIVKTQGGVLRGVRCHFRHDDYLTVVSGRARIGIRDLRPGSPTFGLSGLVDLSGDEPALLKTPAGVAHGLYFPVASTFCIGVTTLHDPEDQDENACHWSDPDLGIPWPFREVSLSPLDAKPHRLKDILPRVPPYRG